jgi:ubiquitin thioesterase protein OTUB1
VFHSVFLVSTYARMFQQEYSSNPNFVRKMEWLKKEGWHGVRRTKGDGDCFYRCGYYISLSAVFAWHSCLLSAFAFAWVERILRAQDRELAVVAGMSTLHTTWLGLAEVGFDTDIVGFSHSLPSRHILKSHSTSLNAARGLL